MHGDNWVVVQELKLSVSERECLNELAVLLMRLAR